MEELNQWIKAALLGSSRANVTQLRASLPESVQSLLGDRAYEQPEEELISLLSLAVPFYKIGLQPSELAQVPPPAPKESRPYCSAPFSQLLRKLLGNSPAFLLQLWVERCLQAGRLAPPDLLPELLQLATKDKSFLFSLPQVLGERAHWLAQQHPSWQEGLISVEEAWETGTSSLRKSAFSALQQADPKQAFSLLETSWTELSAADRSYFFTEIQDHLEEQHLPFLQKLLRDRSKTVKKAALIKLCHTPGSEWHQQFMNLLAKAISVEARGLWGFRTNQLVFTAIPIPGELREGLGLQKESLDKKFTDPEYQWKELLELLPISLLTRQSKLAAHEILTQFLSEKPLQKYGESILQSILHSRDSEWAEAYFELMADQKTSKKAWLPSGNDLIGVLAPSALQRLITQHKLDWVNESKIVLLSRIQFPWGIAFSQLALSQLRETYMNVGIPYHLAESLLSLAEWMPVEMIPRIDSFLPLEQERKESWRNALSSLTEILYYKKQITELTP